MQNTPKKKKSTGASKRPLLLLAALLLLALSIGIALWLNRPVPEPELPEQVSTYGELLHHEQNEVTRISVTLRSGDGWTIIRHADGSFALEDEPDFFVSPSRVESLTRAAAVISYEDVLSYDPSEYRDRLTDFGLDTPKVDARFTYADGSTVHIRIGDPSAMEGESWYYMLVDGDDRLLAIDKGTVEELTVERELLHSVTQPIIHKSRMDAITFADGSGHVTAAWQLDGKLTDDDSGSRWRMTVPRHYPAEAESIDNLRANLANIRLGAYVGTATIENLHKYGFDTPRFVLTIHMGAGTTNSVQSDGSVAQVDWPESTLVFTIGGARSEHVDYVLYDGAIYTSSHYSLNVFMAMDPMNTISRYPVMIPLEKLARFTCNGDEYVLTRTEQLDEEGHVITDDDGSAVYITTVTRNGEPFPYDTFAAAYVRMEVTTVSGTLPVDFLPPDTPPHTVYSFTALSGQSHTVALAPFDALHDAVFVDGEAMFYLIHDGLKFSFEL